MSITLDARSKKVLVDLKNINKVMPRNIRNGLFNIGKILQRTASKNILAGPRQGRLYKYKGRSIRASVEGESWKNRSGTARRSIGFSVRGVDELKFVSKGSKFKKTNYVKFLEDENSLNRPAMKISIEQNNKNIVTIIQDKIDKSFKGKS